MVDVVQAIRDAADALDQKNRRIAELEEALREAVLQIEYLHGKFQETGSGNAAISRARAALTQK